MTWDSIDWAALDRLREGFLSGAAASGPYWKSAGDLAAYDFTYAERIGWKWDQVLRELRLRGWRPNSRHVLDWGCGSGVEARRLISFFGADTFESLTVWDHSPLACDFAAETAERSFPALRVSQATPGLLAADSRIGLLLLSHVLNELSPAARDSLRLLAARADEIIWVEPGTHDVSRQLGAMRELLRAGGFRVVAPCTHENECPMFAEARDRDWCHFFAPPPSEIFADSNWVKFGQRAGIDLRSLPYCFLALARNNLPAIAPESETIAPVGSGHCATAPGQLSRVIGRVEHFKPYARFLNCDAAGLSDLELPKRAEPALYKQLERTKAPLVYRWRREGDKVLGGDSIVAPPEPGA
jgi:hypothetical protein